MTLHKMKETAFFIVALPIIIVGAVLAIGGDYANRAGTWLLDWVLRQ